MFDELDKVQRLRGTSKYEGSGKKGTAIRDTLGRTLASSISNRSFEHEFVQLTARQMSTDPPRIRELAAKALPLTEFRPGPRVCSFTFATSIWFLLLHFLDFILTTKFIFFRGSMSIFAEFSFYTKDLLTEFWHIQVFKIFTDFIQIRKH